LVEALNGLPGVQIYYFEADSRRAFATVNIGELGPGAKSAVPALVQALKGKDAMVHEPALQALGKIHSEPDIVIPLLIGYLDDDNLNDEAALALANYGSLAKPAVPKIIPLLHAQDDDARAAALKALLKIDPEAYTNATKAAESTATNTPPAGPGEGAVKSKQGAQGQQRVPWAASRFR
jgi:HEAT repeat protein